MRGWLSTEVVTSTITYEDVESTITYIGIVTEESPVSGCPGGEDCGS